MRLDMLSRYKGETVLAVGAHPDDVEIGVGGTVARLSRSGTKVVMAVVCVPHSLQNRLKEAGESARILGAELRVLNAERCLRVEDLKTYDVVASLDRLMAEFHPAAILAHGTADFHKDHILVNEACRAALRSNGSDMLCYYPPSCRPAPVDFKPQAYVDITEDIGTKMKAIGAHCTQFSCRGLDTGFFQSIASEQGRRVSVKYAEGFEVVRVRLG